MLFILSFHTVLFMFPFLFYWSHLKVCTVHSSNSSLFCKRSTIGQLNIPAATAENEERHTYSNMIYTGFQNSYYFFEVFFDKQLFLKGRKFNWKLLVVELIDCGPATSPKKHFFKYFQICNFSIFFDIVGTSLSQNGF